MSNLQNKLIRVTMQNYQYALSHPDKIIRYGNNFYIVNNAYNELTDLVTKPLPRNKDYKYFNIKC